MGLARAIQDAKGDELKALAAYLTGECAELAPGRTEEEARAVASGIASAMSAWAYMQLHVQDQGD